MPKLLVVERDAETLREFQKTFQDSDIVVLSARSGADGRELFDRFHPEVAVIADDGESNLDLFQWIDEVDSAVPVILMSANSTANMAIRAIERGVFDYVVKPFSFRRMRELVEQAFLVRRHNDHPSPDDDRIEAKPNACDLLVGESPAMQEVYKAIGRVASKNVNVLILGESGTGKELVAQAIQQHSSRKDAIFLAVNCAAIPETLLESELFGHEKGAFTGADGKRMGKFEQCNGGTLFLDEVGDMTPIMQSKLLRVLQEGQFERVGGNVSVKTDVRIIAATNRDLEQMVAAGQFRADLYYRLNVFTISLPPLRERRSDMPLLVEHFLGLYCREFGKPSCHLSVEAQEMLYRYSWPGNVRELQSALICALLHARGPELIPEYFPADLMKCEFPDRWHSESERSVSLDAFIEERLQANPTNLYAEATAFMEQILLTRVLRHTEGNQSQAALILNITRGTLRSKIRELGISIQQEVRLAAELLSEPHGFSSENIPTSKKLVHLA